MRRLSTVSVLSIFLLAGCATSRPASMEVCDCQRTVHVPDKAFRAWLIDNGLAVKAHGKYLQATPEGCAATELECYDQGIRSLDGIELFPQLEQLTCSDNPISELNVNALPYLQRLYGVNLPLERFDADSCHDLRVIQLSHTHLDTLDLTPFPLLENLFCIYSPLRAIDLAPAPTSTRSTSASPSSRRWTSPPAPTSGSSTPSTPHYSASLSALNNTTAISKLRLRTP